MIKGRVKRPPRNFQRSRAPHRKHQSGESGEITVEPGPFTIQIPFLTQSRAPGLMSSLLEKCARRPKAVVVTLRQPDQECRPRVPGPGEGLQDGRPGCLHAADRDRPEPFPLISTSPCESLHFAMDRGQVFRTAAHRFSYPGVGHRSIGDSKTPLPACGRDFSTEVCTRSTIPRRSSITNAARERKPLYEETGDSQLGLHRGRDFGRPIPLHDLRRGRSRSNRGAGRRTEGAKRQARPVHGRPDQWLASKRSPGCGSGSRNQSEMTPWLAGSRETR